MDATHLEELVAATLKKALPRGVAVIIGPAALGKFSGVRPEVFLHASEFLDFDGQMPDGSRIARHPAKGPSGYRGFEESRPAQLIMTVTLVHSAYTTLKTITNLLVPTVLLSLESESEFPLGNLKNGSVKFLFKDLQRSLYRSNVERVDAEGVSIFRAEYRFKIQGFLNVYVTKRGGLRATPKITTTEKSSKQAKAKSEVKTRLQKDDTAKIKKRPKARSKRVRSLP